MGSLNHLATCDYFAHGKYNRCVTVVNEHMGSTNSLDSLISSY